MNVKKVCPVCATVTSRSLCPECGKVHLAITTLTLDQLEARLENEAGSDLIKSAITALKKAQ